MELTDSHEKTTFVLILNLIDDDHDEGPADWLTYACYTTTSVVGGVLYRRQFFLVGHWTDGANTRALPSEQDPIVITAQTFQDTHK